jgi:D-lactate dehydrogenase (cytochrome)
MNSWNSIINKYTSLFDYTWVALSETEHQKLRDFRHELPLKVNELLSRNRIRKIGSDIAVPDNHLHRFYFFLKNELEATKLPYMNWGHIGNNHFHANLLPQNDIQYQRGLIFLNKCLTKAIELKGTVSGEHGIGKIKKQHLKMMLGEKAIEDMKIMKKVLDPKLLLNRGNLFD